MSAKSNDTLYLAAGGLALAGTCVWAFLLQSDINAFRDPVQAPVSGSPYEPTVINLASLASQKWADAPRQTAGAEWLFDVFTPPVIYYNSETKKFTVTQPVFTPVGPVGPVGPVVPEAPKFGLELVKVEQPLFRLQLVGYIGEGPTARGNFENQRTGDVIFGTTGKKLPDLNLEIVNFTAERRRTKVEGGTEIVETIATALVRDTVTGVETKLDAKVRTPEGPLAVTFVNQLDGSTVTAKTGEVLTVGDNTFTVGELNLSPPRAVVTKAGGDLTEPATETLVIPPPPPPPAPPMEGMDGGVPASEFAPPSGAKPAPGGFPGF